MVPNAKESVRKLLQEIVTETLSLEVGARTNLREADPETCAVIHEPVAYSLVLTQAFSIRVHVGAC